MRKMFLELGRNSKHTRESRKQIYYDEIALITKKYDIYEVEGIFLETIPERDKTLASETSCPMRLRVFWAHYEKYLTKEKKDDDKDLFSDSTKKKLVMIPYRLYITPNTENTKQLSDITGKTFNPLVTQNPIQQPKSGGNRRKNRQKIKTRKTRQTKKLKKKISKNYRIVSTNSLFLL